MDEQDKNFGNPACDFCSSRFYAFFLFHSALSTAWNQKEKGDYGGDYTSSHDSPNIQERKERKEESRSVRSISRHALSSPAALALFRVFRGSVFVLSWSLALGRLSKNWRP
jgi:hypothetical protein